MATIYTGWNYTYGEDWREYVKRRSFTDRIADRIAESQQASAREICKALSVQTKAILLGTQKASETTVALPQPAMSEADLNLLMSAFGQGVETLSSDINRVATGIADLNATFQWGFGEILGELGSINDSVRELAKAVRSRAANAAYEKFDWARDAFRQGLYPECLEYLERAIKIYRLEWRFYSLRGIIQLGSSKIGTGLMNLPEAESSFLLAGRYAKARDPKEAARAYMQAGWAAFVQGKKRLAFAREYTNRAAALDPNLGEAWFQAAKFAIVAMEPEQSAEALGHAIDLDVGYMAKADADPDFSFRNRLKVLYEQKRQLVLRRVLSAPQPSLYRLPCPTHEELKLYGLIQLFAYEKKAEQQIAEHKKRVEEEERKRKDEAERVTREAQTREREKGNLDLYFFELEERLRALLDAKDTFCVAKGRDRDIMRETIIQATEHYRSHYEWGMRSGKRREKRWTTRYDEWYEQCLRTKCNRW